MSGTALWYMFCFLGGFVVGLLTFAPTTRTRGPSDTLPPPDPRATSGPAEWTGRR